MAKNDCTEIAIEVMRILQESHCSHEEAKLVLRIVSDQTERLSEVQELNYAEAIRYVKEKFLLIQHV